MIRARHPTPTSETETLISTYSSAIETFARLRHMRPIFTELRKMLSEQRSNADTNRAEQVPLALVS